MKQLVLVGLVAACAPYLEAARANYDKPNYDEAKVAPYTLEDPLTFVDGRKVTTKADWQKRRAEILDIFQREMYGRMPPAPEAVNVEILDETTDLAGFALRSRLRMTFRKDRLGPHIDWVLWRPKFAKGPVPLILMLNYRGAHEMTVDTRVPPAAGWLDNNTKRGITNHQASVVTRGVMTNPDSISQTPLQVINAHGYAFMTACYADVSPDPCGVNRHLQDSLAVTGGVFALWGTRDSTRTDNTTSLGAWAWALSRGIDFAEQNPHLDAQRIVLTGCSRLGKAALICGAFDERAAVVVPNQTGGGGAPLAKRDFGENIGTEMKAFKHWYCTAYDKYKTDPARLLTFDQHLLLAAVAPRALLIEGFDSPWFDTKGEFLAVQAAAPVWAFLGEKGLPAQVTWPEDFSTAAIGPKLGYVRRSQEHGLSGYDWVWLLKFADNVFGL